MSDIFISYKSERRPAAWHLAKVLECYGYDVWYDYGLIPGDEFEPRLMVELRKAKVVIVLWCGLSVESAWVQKEARFARQRDKYLPCWIEHSRLPEEFAGADTVNLTEWRGEPQSHVLHRLLEDIARRLNRDPLMPGSRPSRRKPNAIGGWPPPRGMPAPGIISTRWKSGTKTSMRESGTPRSWATPTCYISLDWRC
jgi:hypothetical protein